MTHLRRLVALLVVALVCVVSPREAGGQTHDNDSADCDASSSKACSLDDDAPSLAAPLVQDAGLPAVNVTLLFFWGVGCPHCEEAKPFVDAIEKKEAGRLRVERIEVRRDPEGRKRFIEKMKDVGATAIGIPTFVIGKDYVVGYSRGVTDREVSALVERALHPPSENAHEGGSTRTVDLPLVGSVDPTTVSLPALTLAMGLVDGVNPCAMWVLIVLLGILVHVKARRRMILYAVTFIVMSGVVYFFFMTAWTALFGLFGLSRVATMILGGALLAMGLINLKEIVWFKRGPSLVIPDKAKPGLFRRMRAIASAASVPAALGGILTLAFVVNLIELGCTIGLPAVYTRILTTRGLPSLTRYAYLALYNATYIVPLIVIASVFILLRRRIAMTERLARVLKGVSGVILVGFGVLFLLVPDLLLRA